MTVCLSVVETMFAIESYEVFKWETTCPQVPRLRAGITCNGTKMCYAKSTKDIQMDTNYNPDHLLSRYSHHTTGESSTGIA